MIRWLPRSLDLEKIDEAVLALLALTAHRQGVTGSSWKGHDGEVPDRLHEAGYLHNPRNRRQSVDFTEEGWAKAEACMKRLFGKP